jgi:LysR family transcriptional regulator, transcriptional activator of the cysJI operon
MDLEIRLLRTFRAVAEMRSFTGAARNLKLSQSGISQQIGMLERELGTQLLVRSNKFVRLTPAGEILLQCACQVLDNLERVKLILAERSNTNAGRLSVAVPATFCHWLLPRLIDEFHERFPAVQVAVVMTNVDIAIDRVAHREIDIALVPCAVQHKALALAPLGKDELMVVLSPSNPLARKERLLASDLKDQRFITPPPGNLRFVPWDKFLLQSGLFPRILVETDDLELAKHLAQQNVGITIAPRWSLNNEVARHQCAVLPIGPHGLYRDWYLAYHNATQLAGPWRSFLRVCLEHLPRLFRNEGARALHEDDSPYRHKSKGENAEQATVPNLPGLIGR